MSDLTNRAAQAAPATPSTGYPLAAELRDRLRIVYGLDKMMLAPLRIPALALYGVTALVAAFFGLIRIDLFHQGQIPGNALIAYVYIDSIVFLALAFLAGLLSRLGGVIFVLVFSLADLVAWLAAKGQGNGVTLFIQHVTGSREAPSLTTFLGRGISYVLLGLLVLLIPSIVRTVRAELATGRIGRLVIGPLAAAIAAGLFIFGWVTAAPYLLRPVFSYIYAPVTEIAPLQSNDFLLAVGGGLLAFASCLVAARRSSIADLRVALFPWGRWIRRLGPARWVIGYGLLFVFLVGIINSPIDLALLVGAAIIAELGQRTVARVLPIRILTSRLSPTVAVIVALVISLAVGALVSVVAPGPIGSSEFFPFILAVALGMILFRWLLTGPPTPSGRPPLPARADAGTTLPVASLAMLLVGYLLLPSPVLADNCSDWADCRTGHNLILAIIFWLLLVGLPYLGDFLLGLIKTIHVPDPIPGDLASPEGAGMEGGTFLAVRKLVADTVLSSGDTEAYERIKSLSNADFMAALNRGEFAGMLGYDGSYTGGGGLSVGGSAGCLPAGTSIATPLSQRPVESLRIGDMIWSIDIGGRAIARPVIAARRVPVPMTHALIRVALGDGRGFCASPSHPLADGRTLADLTVGDVVDGSRVTSIRLVPYLGGATYDVLPAGDTGWYWADDVLVASTIYVPTTVTSRGKAVSRSKRFESASKSTRSSMRTPVSPSR